ncbi:MAG: PAS domain-containing protein [Rhodocyclaceae bacterium]|nr:PAS domain-containing protein [Rhodocyclaceae bacterium]
MNSPSEQALGADAGGKPLPPGADHVRNTRDAKSVAQRIRKLAKLRTASSITNRAIIRSHSPAEVYRAVCRACVEQAGVELAWIGIADVASQCLVPVEVAGAAADYLENSVIAIRPGGAEGLGPAAIAYREQRAYFCNDLEVDAAHVPWRERAVGHGLRALIALPLLRGGAPFGTFSAYGAERNFFDAESVEMLLEMADNISFAIDQFDLAERRRLAEAKLRASEAMFRTLVESLPQSIFVKDGNLVYLSCNENFAREIGVAKERIAGMTDVDIYAPEKAEKYRQDDLRVLESSTVLEFEESHCHGGDEAHVHIVKAPFRNDAGQIVGVLGACWDVTAARRAEAELSRFAAEVDDLYQNAPCGYHSIDADGTLLRINNTELGWLGYAREELVGRVKLPDLLTAESRAIFAAHFARFKRMGEVHDLELDLVRKDGSVLPVILNSTAVYDAAGRYVASRTTVFDITEGRKLKQERALQAERFENLSRRLVAVQEDERRGLARELHDRANPNLAAIKLILGTLAASMPASVLADVGAMLHDARGLLDDTAAGIREICADLRPTLLDYTGLVPTLEGYAQMFMKRTGVSVRVKLPREWVRLAPDVESMLFRIAQEALTNCAKHACACSVDLELEQSERRLVLVIRDDGFGFEPEALGRTGSMPGLGLINMRERAEFAGARFFLSSHPLSGTEIRVELDEPGGFGDNRPWQHPAATKGDGADQTVRISLSASATDRC